jgi:four helix bundle protein
MLTRFRSYQVAVQFYRQASHLKCPAHLKQQLLRAASSVVLNLSEGSARPSEPDRQRFYSIALGSTRECQSILDLVPSTPASLLQQADILGAHVYRLTHRMIPAKPA